MESKPPHRGRAGRWLHASEQTQVGQRPSLEKSRMSHRSFRRFIVVVAVLVSGSVTPAAEPTATYQVQHALTVKDIPAGSKTVRVWFWLPDDDDGQKLLDLAVREAPAGYKI